VVAGQLLLGELLGDPDPRGAVTPQLKAAMGRYLDEVNARVDRGTSETLVCNDLTAQYGDFHGPARHAACTRLVAEVAQIVDEVLREQGVEHEVTPLTLDDGTIEPF
jgi:hypothetical protein